ncbi:MAG TPA: HAMP domain-containing sensor histidine kinase [Thermoanaerobaculia bacterium]|nr:HAMP domain-containing sensor histidine kinase [Thermoanaerobaculia bacterium]
MTLTPSTLTPIREPSARAGDAPVWRALLRAAQHVGDAFAGPQLADEAPDDARVSLHAICEMVRQAAFGETLENRELRASARAHRLLGELRRALLGELSSVTDRCDTGTVVRVLRAMDDVERIIEQDCTQRFTGRLTAPDGPTMVVEVAHDMRSPLASILFLVETLRNGQSGPLTQVQDRQLGLVYSAAFGLSSLANDVVELARGGERLLGGEPLPFSLVEIFNGVRDITLPIAVEKGLVVRLLPPEADWRMGCPAALHRVLLNLTTNALKFTSEGTVEVTGRQLSRTSVEFTVTDTGQGIPASVMEQLFDAFRSRGRRGTSRFSSAGLGLSMCKKLVRGMGGELFAESQERGGTRIAFTLDLPLAPRL